VPYNQMSWLRAVEELARRSGTAGEGAAPKAPIDSIKARLGEMLPPRSRARLLTSPRWSCSSSMPALGRIEGAAEGAPPCAVGSRG
jgi:hypothetical protein